ncbi:cerebral peptide 1-like [Pomacea canaliculata]|nr:cerebral peptide 1-like [Pomacea canaliculata]
MHLPPQVFGMSLVVLLVLAVTLSQAHGEVDLAEDRSLVDEERRQLEETLGIRHFALPQAGKRGEEEMSSLDENSELEDSLLDDTDSAYEEKELDFDKRAPGWGKRAPGWGKRAPGWGKRAPGWGKRSDLDSAWEKRAPGWGKRAPGWGKRAPGWGKRAPGWGKRAPGWGKRAYI